MPRTLRRIVLTCAALALIAAAANPRALAPPPSPGDCRLATVASNGFHTTLYMPAEAFPLAGPLRAAFPSARWFAIGWGDETFYRQGPGVRRAVDAAIPPSPSVLHVIALNRRPDEAIRADTVDIALSHSGFAQLAQDLEAEIARDATGAPVVVGPGQWPGRSLYFRSPRSYHALQTCNVWTARLLVRAGAPVNAPISAPAQILTGQLALFAPRRCPPSDDPEGGGYALRDPQ